MSGGHDSGHDTSSAKKNVWEDKNLEERLQGIFDVVTSTTENVKAYDSNLRVELFKIARKNWNEEKDGAFNIIKAMQKKEFKDEWEKKLTDLLDPKKTDVHPLNGYITDKPMNDLYEMALNSLFTPYTDQLKKGIGNKDYLQRLDSVIQKNEESAANLSARYIQRDFDSTNKAHTENLAKYLGMDHQDDAVLSEIVRNPQEFVGRAYQNAVTKYMMPKSEKKAGAHDSAHH